MNENDLEKRKEIIYDEWRAFLDFWFAHPHLNMDQAVRLYQSKTQAL